MNIKYLCILDNNTINYFFIDSVSHKSIKHVYKLNQFNLFTQLQAKVY